MLDRVRAVIPALRVVGEDVALPVPVEYDDCGADRVMAVVGALHRRPDARAVLVLEAGTCLTATVGVRGGGVVGGAILPGLALMSGALESGTETLPRIETGPPERSIGRSTAESIRSGIWAAFVGGARELIAGFREEFELPLDVVAAGTDSGLLAAALPEIDAVHPFATLWGVYLTCTGQAR